MVVYGSLGHVSDNREGISLGHSIGDNRQLRLPQTDQIRRPVGDQFSSPVSNSSLASRVHLRTLTNGIDVSQESNDNTSFRHTPRKREGILNENQGAYITRRKHIKETVSWSRTHLISSQLHVTDI